MSASSAPGAGWGSASSGPDETGGPGSGPAPAPPAPLQPLHPLQPLGTADDGTAGWCVDGVCAVPPSA